MDTHVTTVTYSRFNEILKQAGREASPCCDCLILVRIVALPEAEVKVRPGREPEK